MKRRWNILEGLKLDAKYSYNCENARRFNFSDELISFIEGREGVKKIKNILSKLEHFKFREDIAKINKIGDSSDPQVVSHYWKGTPIMAGELWHNYTTLIPILKMPSEFINPKIVDDCLVHPTEIVAAKKNLIVKYRPVIKKDGKLSLDEKNVEKKIENPFMINFQEGDFSTMHFSCAIEKISIEEFKNLIRITESSLEKFNAQRR